MKNANLGDRVAVHLTGRVADGGVFASSQNKKPLEFVLGKSEVIDGIQNAIIGMRPQEKKTVNIPTEKAFGSYRPELVKKVNRELLPDDVSYEVEKGVELPQVNGQKQKAKVIDTTSTDVTLDLNHPLAGKELVCEIQLLRVMDH